MPIEVWWTPTHYGDASADEYAEIKRGLERGGVFKVTLKSAEWAQYSDALGKKYNAFQLGWFPDYPDPENYVLSFYQDGNFTSNGYATPKMTALLKAEQAAKTTAQAPQRHQADPAAGGGGRADHPRLAGQHDRGRSAERARHPEHARRRVHHAVLEADQVVDPKHRGGAREGAPAFQRRARVRRSRRLRRCTKDTRRPWLVAEGLRSDGMH